VSVNIQFLLGAQKKLHAEFDGTVQGNHATNKRRNGKRTKENADWKIPVIIEYTNIYN
jgi:hypothetical protein